MGRKRSNKKFVIQEFKLILLADLRALVVELIQIQE